MVTPVQGLRGTGEFSTDFRPTNYRELFTFLEPNGSAPLNALLAMGASEETDDPKYNNFRDELPERTIQVNGAIADTTTGTITVDAGDEQLFVVAGTILVNAMTGEVMHATADASGTTLTVTRNVGGTTYQIANDDILFVAGSAYKEGADVPAPTSFDPTVAYNYTQIFRNSFTVTNTLKQTYLRTGDKEDEYAMKTLKLHMSDIERSMFFGRRHIINASSAQPTRYTGGLLTSMTANVHDIGTQVTGVNATANVLTEDEFDSLLISAIFAFGSQTKLAFGGAKVAAHLQKFAKDRWTPQTVEGTYGVNFTRYKTFAGDLLFHLHPQFRQIPEMDEAMVIVDFPYIKYRYMRGRDTNILRDRQNNGEDSMKHEYLTECGLELLQDKVHAYIYGWSSIVTP